MVLDVYRGHLAVSQGGGVGFPRGEADASRGQLVESWAGHWVFCSFGLEGSK